MLTEHKILFRISHSLTAHQDTSLTGVQHRSPVPREWPHSATYDWMLNIKRTHCSHTNISQKHQPGWLGSSRWNHISTRAVLNANEQAGTCLGFWAEFISKQTEYMSKCAPLQVYILNETFGNGANEEPGDWKREIGSEKKRGEGSGHVWNKKTPLTAQCHD